MVGKHSVKASCSCSSLWTPPLRGDVSVEASKFRHTLQMASTYGKHNISLTGALNNIDKVGGFKCLFFICYSSDGLLFWLV